jgi:hypothetical protein
MGLLLFCLAVRQSWGLAVARKTENSKRQTGMTGSPYALRALVLHRFLFCCHIHTQGLGFRAMK